MADEQKVSPQLQQFLMQVTVLHRFNMQHAGCAQSMFWFFHAD